MPSRKTPEEMAFAARIKTARTLVRLKHSLEADMELNNLLADMTEGHNLELHSGGLKILQPGTLEKVIEDVADTEDVNRGVVK
jgi:hypothetical protein